MSNPTEHSLIIRRALELSDRAAENLQNSEPLDALSLEQIGSELGIPRSALAQAMAESAVEPADKEGLVGKVLGPATVTVHHRSTETAAEARERLKAWMEQEHGLRTRSTPEGVVVGVRRRDAVAAVGRTVRKVSGRGGLSKIQQLRGSSVRLQEDTATALAVSADVSDRRKSSAVVGAFAAAVGCVPLAALVPVVGAVVVVGVPVAVGSGALVARAQHRSTLRKVEIEVETFVDLVAAGAGPTNLADSVVEGLKRAGESIKLPRKNRPDH